MTEEQANEKRQESKDQEQPARRARMSDPSGSSNMAVPHL